MRTTRHRSAADDQRTAVAAVMAVTTAKVVSDRSLGRHKRKMQ